MLSFIIKKSESVFRHIPEYLILFIARFSLAAVFWQSAQTKITGFSLDIISWHAHFSLPHLSDSAVYLFENEYHLPFVSPILAATLAAIGEHVFSALLLMGFFTRFAALGIAGMTMVIQLFVYPEAYPTQGTWLTIAMLLMYRGAGMVSVDYWLTRHSGK